MTNPIFQGASNMLKPSRSVSVRHSDFRSSLFVPAEVVGRSTSAGAGRLTRSSTSAGRLTRSSTWGSSKYSEGPREQPRSRLKVQLRSTRGEGALMSVLRFATTSTVPSTIRLVGYFWDSPPPVLLFVWEVFGALRSHGDHDSSKPSCLENGCWK